MAYVFAPGVVCIAGLLLSRRAALLAAVALSLLPGIPTAGLAAIWLTTLAFWMASDYIYAALNQASDRQRRALQLEQELLTRRGELRRLNDSLRNAYTLLERTNHELAAARDEAEEARRLKAQFAAAISHELRTPLNLILGFAEVMHTTPESYRHSTLDADLRGDIREVYLNTKHLLELVDDVLDLSRIEQVRLAMVPEDADLADLVAEAMATVAGLFRGKPVALVADVPRHLPRCTVDRTRIRQVLINLLTNAARFVQAGRVEVAARYHEQAGEVVVSVSDTGPGITPEERCRIFDAFYQVANPLRKGSGSGLGLAICKTFVQMHGGRIWLDTEVGQGCRFSFSIPTRPQPLPTATDWRLPAAPDPFGDSIVAVDGDGRYAKLLARAVSGATVHVAADPGEAAEAVRKWHPKAVVVFGGNGGAHRPWHDAAPVPGLPWLTLRPRHARPLTQFANVRGVITKPVTSEALVAAVDALGPLRSLLVADDDAGMARLVQRTLALSMPHLRVTTAHDGEQALARMREDRPDGVIMDVAMPALDGLGVLQAMAEGDLAAVPVLVLTAMDLDGSESEMGVERLEVSSVAGLSGADVVRYVEAVTQASRPRYTADHPLAEPA